MSSLHDDRLEMTVSSIMMMEAPAEWNVQVLDDCIREVLKFPRERSTRKEEMIKAERSGDFASRTNCKRLSPRKTMRPRALLFLEEGVE